MHSHAPQSSRRSPLTEHLLTCFCWEGNQNFRSPVIIFFSTFLLQNNKVRLPNVQPLAINQAVTVSERCSGSSHLEPGLNAFKISVTCSHNRGGRSLFKGQECHLVVKQTHSIAPHRPPPSIQSTGWYILFLPHFNSLMQNVWSNASFSFNPCGISIMQANGK